MCLAQGPQLSDVSEARARGPSVWSQALFHGATALPLNSLIKGGVKYPANLAIYLLSLTRLIHSIIPIDPVLLDFSLSANGGNINIHIWV